MIENKVESNKYSQEGLDVILEGNIMTITRGKLVYEEIYELKTDTSFLIDDQTKSIIMIKNLETKEIEIAETDGSYDKQNYQLIERLAWKDDWDWHKLRIVLINIQQAPKYNYGGLTEEEFKKGLVFPKSQE